MLTEEVVIGADGGGSLENGGGPVLCMVNGVWVSQQFPLEPSYKEVRKEVYDCEAGMVDFATKADEVLDEVNSWTKITRRGLIKNLLGPGSLSSLTTHIVVNVLYFKGIWTHSQRFKAKLTENRDFYLLNGNIVSVPFMTSYQDYCSRPFDGFSRACSQGRSLAAQSELKTEISTKIRDFYLRNGDTVSVPLMASFKSYDCRRLDGFKVLRLPYKIGVSVTKIFQKAGIEVDKKGTEARAAIAMMAAMSCEDAQDRKLSFLADHPFLFMIKEEIWDSFFFRRWWYLIQVRAERRDRCESYCDMVSEPECCHWNFARVLL
ncbi:hypothetical protein Acr_21g0005950 [Actinidia rufa]|uniref:Serpin domain-containing protein n=1 Tax=Actinidia rufa TaxID=165716 RepID=A0A7J0GGR6_9ERIC|nr:hypothetical protein Acr_21g0005950 [Actinidia rufa]